MPTPQEIAALLLAPPQAVQPAIGDMLGARLATYGGTGVYSGGAYDDFRRSDSIEDRRKERLRWEPGPFGGTPQGEPNVFDTGDLTGLNVNDMPNVQPTPAGIALGVNDIDAAGQQLAAARLEAERAEHDRRKAAGELVWDARFDPPLSEMESK